MKQSDRATARLDNAIDGLAALYENGSLLAVTDPATLLIMATVEIRLSRTKVVPAPDLRSGFLPPLPSEIVPAPDVTCGTPALEVCVAHCTQERERS